MKFRFALAVLLTLPRLAWADVVISEIHYDPTPKTDRSEFLELHNTGDAAVDLSGWYFSDGVSYTFPAGSSLAAKGDLVLAINKPTFDAKFPSAPAFAQVTSGGLSNEGERLTLRNQAGLVQDELDYGLGFPWPTTPNYDKIALANPRLRKDVDASAQLVNPGLDNNLGGHWRSAPPTPGAANSVHLENAPPAARQVDHSPKVPKSGEAVLISAKVTDPNGVASVLLQYQVVLPGQYIRLTDAAYATGWVDLPMLDDGKNGDAVGADTIYTATIPKEIQQHRNLVRYRLVVKDATNQEATLPYADDPQPNFAYFVYDGVPAWTGSLRPGNAAAPNITYSQDTMRSLPVYQLLAVEADVIACQYSSAARSRRFYGTFVYENKVYDHMGFETRGQASTYQVGKNKWDFEFPRGHRFAARDIYGRPYKSEWKEINGLPGTNPWWADDASTDGTILNEPLAFRIYQLSGVPSSDAHYFQLRIIDKPEEASAASQYEGDLWGLYVAVEDTDNRFLERRNLPDGNIYHLAGSFIKRNQGATQPASNADITAFSSASAGYKKTNPPQSVDWYKANFALDNYYSWNVATLLTNNSDMRWAGGQQRNVIVYHNPSNNLWYAVPWDLDLTFENAPHLRTYGDIPQWEQFHYCLQHPELSAAYQSRARELMDLLFNPEQAGMLVDEYSRLVHPLPAPKDLIPLTQVVLVDAVAKAQATRAHGFKTGDMVTIRGADALFAGTKAVTVISDTEFTYEISTSQLAASGPMTAFRALSGQSFADVNQAMWDYHPRKAKKGIWYLRIKGIPSRDFEGYMAYIKAFLAPGGYGYENLKKKVKEDLAPEKPSVTYTGPANYPSDKLSFEVSAFRSPSGLTQQFGALQWRISEITDPTNYDPTVPRRYEVDDKWRSPEITSFASSISIPAVEVNPGDIYRVRARMRNTDGHWSHWSDPIQFVASSPDVSIYTKNLLITELMIDPAAPSADDLAKGFTDADQFEFVELKNIGTEAVDLTPLRFTKGLSFDFAGGTIKSLAPGAFALVVAHPQAFEQRYGKGLPVAGVFSGKLSNNGETIKLSYGGGAAIREFGYDNTWPGQSANKSLSLASPVPSADLNNKSSWKDGPVGGSPGRDDALAPPPSGGYAEWVKVHFRADEQASISGADRDPDSDGASNFAEFAFATDPKDPSGSLVTLDRSGQKLLLSHGIQPDEKSLSYTIQVSDDLRSWASLAPAAESVAEVGQRSVRTVEIPATLARRFVRVLASPSQ